MWRVSKDKMLFFCLLIVAFIGYYVTERRQDFSLTQFYIAFSYALGCTILFFLKKKKKNYFDFDTLFILILFLIGYLASFSYGEPFYKALFFFEFDYRYLNSGTWLYTIGLISYFCGGIDSNGDILDYDTQTIYPTKPLFISFVFIVCVFLGTGGLAHFASAYHGESVENGITSYLILLMVVNSIILISVELINVRRFKYYKIHWVYIVFIVFISILLMSVGNRTAASQMLLPLIGLYTLFFRPVSLKLLIISLFPIFILMYVIQITRGGENLSFQLESPMLMARDLTIPHRATFEAMSYVDENGYTYGKNMSGGIINIIPGIARIIIGESREFGSAEILTTYTFTKLKTPPEYQIGLGTNVISDIYISFGCFGVAFFMWLLGSIVKKSVKRSNSGSLVWTIVLAGLLANSVFLARASYSHPLRYILWSIFFCGIYLSFYRVYLRKQVYD